MLAQDTRAMILVIAHAVPLVNPMYAVLLMNTKIVAAAAIVVISTFTPKQFPPVTLLVDVLKLFA